MTAVRATSRTLIALFAALALVLVVVLAAFSVTTHNQAGSTWNHRTNAGSTWNHSTLAGSTWNNRVVTTSASNGSTWN
jgi:hypothetical protein